VEPEPTLVYPTRDEVVVITKSNGAVISSMIAYRDALEVDVRRGFHRDSGSAPRRGAPSRGFWTCCGPMPSAAPPSGRGRSERV